jgi:MoaA/NifB/PqqE/SkfB family radical SAM enzyme
MEQKDMSWAMIKKAIDDNPPQPGDFVIIQGEGEPSLHKDLFRAAVYAKEAGYTFVETTTNGSHKHPEKFKVFDTVRVSVDSMNLDDVAEVGRYNLPATLKFILELKKHKINVIVISVNMPGKEEGLQKVKVWCRENNLSQIVQSLAVKPDYAIVYPHINVAKLIHSPSKKYKCFYPKGKFININGVVQPCCRIKNLSQYESLEIHNNTFKTGTAPVYCLGCEMLREHK